MLSPEARATLLGDPVLFCTHYFGERLEPPKQFHIDLVDKATSERLSLILFPAQHGKTTWISTMLPIWAVCKDPNILIGIIGKNDSEATSISTSIQAELISNTRLINDFGSFKPTTESKPWAVEKMSIDQKTSISKEPTFAFFGAGSKHTLGHRTHWTICDDVVTAENSATPEVREKLRGWFNKSVRTMNLPGGRTTVVGTMFDPQDLYADLMEMVNPETGQPIWEVVYKDSIVDEENHLTLWPEKWPWNDLMGLKAEMGTLDFNKRMRNIAVDASRMVFKEEYVKGGYIKKTRYPGCVDKNYRIGEFEQNWKRIAGFDPAAGRGRSAKFCAHMTLGMGSCPEHDKCIWVIDIVREQLTLPQQVETILAQHEKYDLFRSVIEANSYQIGLYEEIRRKMEEAGVAYQMEPHYTTRTNKPDPELGINAMSPWFENGQFHIPWGDHVSQRKMSQFVDELIQYPGRTTDTVMATWFAWRNLQESAPRFQSSNYLRKPGSAWTSLAKKRRVVKNPYYAR